MRKKAFLIAFISIVLLTIALLIYVIPKKEQNENADDIYEKISVRMKWFYAGTMTGWFSGKEKGIFYKERIDLKITPGGPDNNAVKLVAAGTDQFGVAGADEVLLSREKGIPIVAIAVLFKESPLAFISKKNKGIVSPVQWSNKVIEVSYGSNAEVQYRAILKKYNISNVIEVPYTYSLAPFMSDKVDISVAYLMDQVNTLKNKGIEMNIIAAKDEGINPYGDVIITTEEMVKKKPELVDRFLRAAITSQKWAIENPEEAVKILINEVPELKYENEYDVWESTIPFLLSNTGISQIGIMQKERWDETYNILKEFDFIKGDIDINKAFIERIR